MDIAVATTDDYYYPGDFYNAIARVNVILSHDDRTFEEPKVVFEDDPVGFYEWRQLPRGRDGLQRRQPSGCLGGFRDAYVRVLLGDGEGQLASASDTNWYIPDQGSGMAVGDLNGDETSPTW